MPTIIFDVKQTVKLQLFLRIILNVHSLSLIQ